jgi:hypothetical protein
MDKVYFLESIERSYAEQNYSSVTLFDASLFYEVDDLEMSEYYTTATLYNDRIITGNLSGFVYFNSDAITNANGSSIAKHFIYQNTALRRLLINNSTSELQMEVLSNIVFSYHVNVGHGNCSFVVDEGNKTIWAIDCSNYDYLIKMSYQDNINYCIDHIKRRFGFRDFNINYFILTHQHFDHYSGIARLMDIEAINSRTVIYLNQYYSMPSPVFNKTIQRIGHLGLKIVEPVTANSNSSLEILYPPNRLVKTKNTIYNHLNPIIDPNPNNASIVFNLKSSKQSFMFTGDIETDAWDKINNCIPYLRECNFYAVSHHGSINGHLRRNCVASRMIESVADCLDGRALPIIMGRTNAYSGVPSKLVLSDFKNVAYSEKDNLGKNARFLEVDWSSNAFKWY